MSVPIGTYFLERDQLELSLEEAKVVQRFHDLYYRRWLEQGADTINLSWFGYETSKCPLDLWIYQELLVAARPDRRVITIDIEAKPNRPEHGRIKYLTGSSTDRSIIEDVTRLAGGKRAMVSPIQITELLLFTMSLLYTVR